jgi:RecB family endonuclease NucS
LGERLLVITNEFDEFDQSNNRLDILALDENKKLVVIELKRDASGSLADLEDVPAVVES